MDAISNIQAAVVPTLQARSQSAPVLPKSQAPSLPLPQPAAALEARIEAAQQGRIEVVRSAAQKIANANILGSTRFAIYKGPDGQLVTRFTDSQTGKVTYIPEQRMVELGGQKAGPTVTIDV